MVGNMVETGFIEDLNWSSRVVRVVLEDIERRKNTLKACQIVRKTNYVMTSWFLADFCFKNAEDSKNDRCKFGEGDNAAYFRTCHAALLKFPM